MTSPHSLPGVLARSWTALGGPRWGECGVVSRLPPRSCGQSSTALHCAPAGCFHVFLLQSDLTFSPFFFFFFSSDHRCRGPGAWNCTTNRTRMKFSSRPADSAKSRYQSTMYHSSLDIIDGIARAIPSEPESSHDDGQCNNKPPLYPNAKPCPTSNAIPSSFRPDQTRQNPYHGMHT